jgi:hypothetical protein
MFDRFIRLAKARKALDEGRYEDAGRLCADPQIAGDRRAEDVRRAAARALSERARGLLQAGDAALAVRTFEAAQAIAADPGVDGELATARVSDAAQALSARETAAAIARAKALAESGKIQDARQAVLQLGDAAQSAARDAFLAWLTRRADEAQRHAECAGRAIAAGDLDAARSAIAAATALDEGSVAQQEQQGASAAMRVLRSDVAARLGDGDVAGALRRMRALSADWRLLAACEGYGGVRASIGARALEQLADPARASDVDLLDALCAEGDRETAVGSDALIKATACAARLRSLPALRASGRLAELAETLAALGAELPSRAFAAESADVAARDAKVAARVETARGLAARGDLDAARNELAQALADEPLHGCARAELEALERGAFERAQRLEVARADAAQGRLRSAYAAALACAQPLPHGAAAAALAADLQARLGLVERGLDEVRLALHARPHGGLAAVRVALLRVSELNKQQVDHPDLPSFESALQREAEVLERAEAAMHGADGTRDQELTDVVAAMLAARDGLFAAGRLDARIQALVDRCVQRADRALLGGRVLAAAAFVPCLVAANAAGLLALETVERVRASCVEREARADHLVAVARACLLARDLAGAEEACEQARRLCSDRGAVRALDAELEQLRRREAGLARASALAKAGDPVAARAEMDAMGETPSLLRTRIYDMKKSIAEAQGLDGAFVLRVDEGGEFLVLRGETISIGNVRDGSADLPILCALAGRHARIERSMSFHGGMVDSIVAENGDVAVGGQKVARHALRSGERFRLGSALQAIYSTPCSRSLTAMVQLLGGFQAAGTDRVLLLKDRGRDGRICIGAGSDVHVRVAAATAEVEVFGSKTGQLRVRCANGGTIDGVAFSDEHPVDAGAVVDAGGIRFVLMPWNRR